MQDGKYQGEKDGIPEASLAMACRELGNREQSHEGWQSKEGEIIIIKREMK